MLLLLPPSEGKSAPAGGAPLDLTALTSPALNPARERLLDTVAAVSARPGAATLLGTGPAVAAEVARNTALRTAPAGPAARVYTGVLYTAARLGDLPRTARARAARSVRIVSGLWGVLSPADRVPAYRLPMGAELPGVGALARFWRPHLRPVLDAAAAGEVVVDCRSAVYVAAWRPPAGTAHLSVQVVRERAGRRQVVSHHAKQARGLLTHHLLTRPGRPPRSAEGVAAAAEEMVATGTVDAVELRPGRAGAGTLVLVQRA